jgi:hypothetical protein
VSTSTTEDHRGTSQEAAILRSLRTRLRWPLLLVTVAFVGLAGWRLAQRWEGGMPELEVLPALVALIPMLGVTLAHALGWWLLARGFSGRPVPVGPAFEVVLLSQLGRYLPAKAGVPLLRLAHAERLLLTPAQVLTTTLLEIATYTATGAVVGFLGLAAVGSSYVAATLGGSTAAAGGVVLVVALALVIDRARLPRSIRRWFGGEEAHGPAVPMGAMLAFLGVWMAWLVHGVLIVLAVGGSIQAAVAGAPWFALAPIAGFLALVAPGGIGVREAVIAMGLAPSIGAPAALTVALLSRAYSLGMDVATWLAARAITSRRA